MIDAKPKKMCTTKYLTRVHVFRIANLEPTVLWHKRGNPKYMQLYIGFGAG